jgi:hypothetical protein
MKYPALLLISIVISMCQNHQLPKVKIPPEEGVLLHNESIDSYHMDYKTEDSLFDLAMQNDTNAINELLGNMCLQGKDHSWFYYALRLANALNDPRACFDVYASLSLQHPGGMEVWLTNTDDTTRDFALYYLIKSHELGYKHCEHEIALATRLFGPLPPADDLITFGNAIDEVHRESPKTKPTTPETPTPSAHE